MVGALLYCAVLIGRRDGTVTGTGVRALRFASTVSAGWAVAMLITIPVSYAYVFGDPVAEIVPARGTGLRHRHSAGRGMLVTLAVALVIAVGARFQPRTPQAGFSSSLWWGLAPLALGRARRRCRRPRSGGRGSRPARTRRHAVVRGPFRPVGVPAQRRPGAGDGVTALQPDGAVLLRRRRRLGRRQRAASHDQLGRGGQLRDGRLAGGKVACLLVLGGLGALHRNRTLPALAVAGRSAFVRLAAAEPAVMTVAIATGAALAHRPPMSRRPAGACQTRSATACRPSPPAGC